jgi:hypothetical protein
MITVLSIIYHLKSADKLFFCGTFSRPFNDYHVSSILMLYKGINFIVIHVLPNSAVNCTSRTFAIFFSFQVRENQINLIQWYSFHL